MRQFNVNRRMLSIILCIVLICTFTLSIAYAALSAVLTINGNAEVVASNWNIHLDNPRVSSGSVTTTLPVISGNTMTFSSSLVDPGDYYEFTVDVVNEGTIDAMIDSVVVTPTLTDAQKKYLRYEVTYQNGESISTKQTLKKGSLMPIKVRVEFRNDISPSDLPSTSTNLSHKVTLVYSQSDGTGSSVTNDGQGTVFASGDINDIGTIVTIGTEQFYVIGTENDNLKLLAMYNLHVGNKITLASDGKYLNVQALENSTGMQDSSAIGYVYDSVNEKEVYPFIGTTAFYDISNVSDYYSDVKYNGSIVEGYVNNYKNLLESKYSIDIVEARLITYDELADPLTFACDSKTWSCSSSPYEWIYSTSYWTGTVIEDRIVSVLTEKSYFSYDWTFTYDDVFGVRPVIVIPRNSVIGKNMIEFTVDGTVFQAEENMTWAEWVDSSYDSDDDFGIDGEYIGHFRTDDEFLFMEYIYNNPDCNDEGDICGLGISVIKDDIIIPGHDYYGG